MPVHVLLADDHQLLRQGMANLLKEAGMTVVGEAEDGRAALALARKLNPDVVVMDIGMPGLNGVEATRQLRETGGRVRVLALSMHADRRFVASMLEAGASGYLTKDCAAEELVHAIRAVTAGQVYLGTRITGVVVEDYVRQRVSSERLMAPALTAREREVLQLIAEGKSTKEIASDLNVSIKTIETHRRQIMIKLDAHSLAELTKYAIREGLTSVEG